MSANDWPFEYYSILKTIYNKTGIYLFYDINTDKILSESEIDLLPNYRLGKKFFITGTRNSINILYSNIKNNIKITKPKNYKLNKNKVLDKYFQIKRKYFQIKRKYFLRYPLKVYTFLLMYMLNLTY